MRRDPQKNISRWAYLHRGMHRPLSAPFILFETDRKYGKTGFHCPRWLAFYSARPALTLTSGMFFRADRLAGGGPRSLRSCSCSLQVRACMHREKKTRKQENKNKTKPSKKKRKCYIRKRRFVFCRALDPRAILVQECLIS